jgi:hypothetical protein
MHRDAAGAAPTWARLLEVVLCCQWVSFPTPASGASDGKALGVAYVVAGKIHVSIICI